MISIPPEDDLLSALDGQVIRCEASHYRVGNRIGAGGMSVVFFGLREETVGRRLVVLKLVQPWVVRRGGGVAALSARKEVEALRRLSERVPPSPFVIKLVDSGVLDVEQGGKVLALPWIALEFVHGGPEGTTLEARVEHSIKSTGFAFDPARAAHAIDCIAQGLAAVHEVGVVHRDIKPGNVLACGFGAEEIFKITDFGLARPEGMAETFGLSSIGTPGFAAPEQASFDERKIGPHTDVFALTGVAYYAITGEPLFPVESVESGIALAKRRERPSIAAARTLCPELRENQPAVAALDAAILRGSAGRSAERTQTALELRDALCRWLRPTSSRRKPIARQVASVVTQLSAGSEAPREGAPAAPHEEWTWTVHRQPGSHRVIRSVAWDGDGHGLAATDRGLSYWDGAEWRDVSTQGLPRPDGVRFVVRSGAGQWLVGGEGAMLAMCGYGGVGGVVFGPDPTIRYEIAAGSFDDMLVLLGTRRGGAPTLFAHADGAWLDPVAVDGAQAVTSLAQVDDARWLVAGAGEGGAAFLGMYRPLARDVRPIRTSARPFAACASRADRGVWLATGVEGTVAGYDGARFFESTLESRDTLTAAAIDVTGRAWAGARGRLLSGHLGSTSWWSPWQDPKWKEPFVSMFADVGMVLAVTSSGGVLEGRADVPTLRSRDR